MIASQLTQKVKNIVPVICGPSRVKVVGWMKSSASRMARKLTGISATPNSAYTADTFARRGPSSIEKRSMKYAE